MVKKYKKNRNKMRKSGSQTKNKMSKHKYESI